MVIGNPDVFSIMIDVVDDWNYDRSFNNGLLFMGINGNLLMPKTIVATLNTEIYTLLNNLKSPKKDEKIFNMEKKRAFKYIYSITFPDDYNLNNDYSYEITPNVFSDNNYFVFMVSNGEKIRILASSGEVTYDVENSTHDFQSVNVIEAYLTGDELKLLISKLEKFFKDIRKDQHNV